jgi:WD40 repeat protein
MTTTTALVVPVFIWHAPPSHNVTASYLSLEQGKFITASDKGHVVLWKFSAKNDDKQLEPHLICFTQEAVSINALEMGPYNERECIIGVNEFGSVFVWSLTDGQCQVSRSNIFKCSPTALKLLPDRRHLAASGHSPYVEILDLLTMKVVRKMGPHQDWLCGVDWCMHSRQPMMVSISLDNLFRMWLLDEDLLQASEVASVAKEEHLAVMMIPLTDDKGATLGKPRQSIVNPSGCAIMVVHERQVSVFPLPITNTSPGWCLRSKQPIISAFWCDDLTVLVFNALGQGFLHRLPRSLLPMSAQPNSTSYSSMLFGSHAHAGHHGTSSANALHADHTTDSLSPSSATIPQSLVTKRLAIREAGQVHDIFKIHSSFKPSLIAENGTLLAELKVPEKIRRTFAVTEIVPGCVDNIVYLIHGNGQVIVWDLPLTWDRDMVQSEIPPSFEARLSDGWATKSGGAFGTAPLPPSNALLGLSSSFSQSNIFNIPKPDLISQKSSIPSLNFSGLSSSTSAISNGHSPSGSVDSMHVAMSDSAANHNLDSLLQSSSGMSRSAFVTASMVLEKKLMLISGYSDGTICMSKLPLDMNPRYWRAHHARINTLLLIPSDNKEYLISGSDDYYIRVWDLDAEPPVLVHTFANHGGPVRSLFSPDPHDVRRRGWKTRFFSIGEDRTVGLFGVDRTPHCVRVFPNHPSAISEVRWRPDEDYLMVQCTDGSLSIWEMESGSLESSVRGYDAEERMKWSKPLSRGEAGSALKPVSRQSITGVSIPIEDESPVQAVLLNIKYISQELAEHLQAFDQQRQAHQAKMREAQGKPPISPRNPNGITPVGPSLATTNPPASTASAMASRASDPPPSASTSSVPSPSKDTAPLISTEPPKSMKLARGASGKLATKPSPGRDNSSAKISMSSPTVPRETVGKNPVDVTGSSSAAATSAVPMLGGAANPRLSLFLSAAQLGAYRSCAYLLPWGLDQDNDQLVIAQLYLKPPKPPVSYGMLGADGNMSVLVPRSSELAGRWQCSDSLTALHTLASVAISKCLLAYDVNESLQTHENRNASSHLMSYFCVLLPEKVPQFVNPSPAVLAAFWQDPLEDIMQAARVIFSSVLGRLTHEQRRMLAIAWGSLLTRNTNISSATNTKGNASAGYPSVTALRPASAFLRNQSVLVLSILGCEYPESLPTELAANVALELLEIIFEASNSRMRVAAAELFGKGFQLWSQHLHEEASSLIHRLFKLAMVAEPKNLSKTAARALTLIGQKIPSKFVHAISTRFTELIKSGGTVPSSVSSSSSAGSHTPSLLSSPSSSSLSSSGYSSPGPFQGMLALSADNVTPSSPVPSPAPQNAYVQSLREHSKVLVIIGRLVRAHPADFYPELPSLVEAIVKALHPHIPGLREATLSNGTAVLNLMTSLYPMLAIDLTDQRLAVGTRDGQVHIYDLNTATRVHTLNCHAPFAVSAVAFAGANRILATYSLETGQVKVWKTTQSLFGILSGEPQTVKTFEVPCSVAIPPMNLSSMDPPVTVISLKNISDAAPPSSKTLKDLRQKKVDKITGASSSTPTTPKKSQSSHLPIAQILEGLSFSWPNPRSIQILRKWEDPALSTLSFPY